MFDNIEVLQKTLAITGIALGAAIIFFIAYYFIYKFYINKKIASGDRTPHTAIVSPAVVAVTIGVIIWIASYVFLMFNVQVIGMVSGDIYSVSADSANLLVEDQYNDARNRIARSCVFTSGDIHADTKTFDLKLSLETDIVLGKNDKLTFRIGDSKCELKKDKDGRFTGTVQATVLQESHQGILTLESDGEKISEILSDDTHFLSESNAIEEDIWAKCFPYIESSIENYSLNGNEVNAEIKVYSYSAYLDKNNNFTEMKLVFADESKVIKEVDLINSKDVKKDGNSYTYNFKGTVKEGKNIECYVLAKDNYGYSYKLDCEFINEVFNNEGENGNIIYDVNGNTAMTFYGMPDFLN